MINQTKIGVIVCLVMDSICCFCFALSLRKYLILGSTGDIHQIFAGAILVFNIVRTLERSVLLHFVLSGFDGVDNPPPRWFEMFEISCQTWEVWFAVFGYTQFAFIFCTLDAEPNTTPPWKRALYYTLPLKVVGLFWFLFTVTNTGSTSVFRCGWYCLTFVFFCCFLTFVWRTLNRAVAALRESHLNLSRLSGNSKVVQESATRLHKVIQLRKTLVASLLLVLGLFGSLSSFFAVLVLNDEQYERDPALSAFDVTLEVIVVPCLSILLFLFPQMWAPSVCVNWISRRRDRNALPDRAQAATGKLSDNC